MYSTSHFTYRAMRFILTVVILKFCWHNSLVQAAPPVVSSLPTTKYVGELENGQRLLHVFTISDANGDSFTCDATIAIKTGTGTLATDPEFQVKHNTGNGNHELWVTDTASFDLATTLINAYRVEIICTDFTSSSSTPQYIDLEVVAGEVVALDNVKNNAATVNAKATGIGRLVHTVSPLVSHLGHPLEFFISVNPSMAPLDEYFVIDNSTGRITTNREMKYLDRGTTTVYLTVTALDKEDFIEIYETFTVNMINQNTIPSTANLDTPRQESVLETVAAEYVFFTLTVVDPDLPAQSHTYSVSCVPSVGNDIFEVTNDGSYSRFKLQAGQVLDHESITFFNCSIYVSDDCHTGGPFVYELTVADDNEPPTFATTMYYATVNEGNKKSSLWYPGFSCTDPDVGDSTRFVLAPFNDSHRFGVDSSNGSMFFDTNYNVDNSAMPSSVILTVCCVDTGGQDGVDLSGCTQITITIDDINDNNPVFGSASYTFIINQNINPGDAVGTVPPTDDDSGTYGATTCTGTSSDTYGPAFSVGQDCVIYFEGPLDFNYGTHTTYAVTATDGGDPGLQGTTAVDIVYREATTTTTTTTTAATTTEYNFFDHPENIAMLTMLLLMALLLLALLSWLLARLCCGCGTGGGGLCKCMSGGGRGKMYPPRQVMPNSPPPQYEPRFVEKQRLRVVRTMGRPGITPGYYPRLPQQGSIPGTLASNPATRGFY